MNSRPIIIVPGEKKSIFFEIFFKTLKIKKFKSPLVLICSKKILLTETRRYKFKRKIQSINYDQIFQKKLTKKDCY